jgi:hypothetical protein
VATAATAIPTIGAERAALVDSIEAMLRPLMPLVLNYGVTYADAQDVLRALFVETMGERIRQQGREASIGRIAVMAGLNRGEVAKLIVERDEREATRSRRAAQTISASNVMAVWHDDPRFNTPYGAPLDLSLSVDPGFKTLDELIAVACPGADKDLILDELVASDSVEIHSAKFIRPTARIVMANSDITGIARIGRQTSALAATCVHNFLRSENDPSYFEQSATTGSGVDDRFVEDALAYLRENGQAFMESTDRWVTDNEKAHEERQGSRVGIGLFFYKEGQGSEKHSNNGIKRVMQ